MGGPGVRSRPSHVSQGERQEEVGFVEMFEVQVTFTRQFYGSVYVRAEDASDAMELVRDFGSEGAYEHAFKSARDYDDGFTPEVSDARSIEGTGSFPCAGGLLVLPEEGPAEGRFVNQGQAIE